VPHYVTYTSKRNFKDPLEYVPERWIPSNERYASDRKEALQPFSKGSRDCLGKK
jgi:cytochrome P450